MERRRFLAALAAGSALAGCISESSPGGDGTSEPEPTTDRETTTTGATTTVPPTTTPRETTTVPPTSTPAETTTPPRDTTTTTHSGVVTDTDAPDPPTTTATPEPVALQAAPGDCPTYGENVVRVVCHDAAPSDAPMVMEPSRGTLSLPGEIEFTLENGTDTRFETNFYSARLDKFVDGEWFLIAPRAVPMPLTPLPAGASQTWVVSMSSAVEELSTPGSSSSSGSESSSDDTRRRTVGGLGGGRYAFGINGNFKGGSYKRQTAFAATVELRGDPAELTTSDDITDVTVNGDVLTARLRGGYTESEGAREAIYVLERTEEPPDTRLITEQLLRPGGIGPPNLPRDALALVTERDVREVRLTGPTTASPPFGVEERVIGYEGTPYAISTSVTGTETDA